MKIFRPLEIFFRNLRDSFRYSLKDFHRKTNILDKSRLDDDLILEYILYGIPNNIVKRPIIKINDETINEIITTNKSCARFGDGEIVIADGGSIPFQRADKKLAKRLQEILANTREDIIITISRIYYYPDILNILQETNQMRKHFKLYEMPKLRRRVDKYINYNSVYYDGIHREVVNGMRGGGEIPSVA